MCACVSLNDARHTAENPRVLEPHNQAQAYVQLPDEQIIRARERRAAATAAAYSRVGGLFELTSTLGHVQTAAAAPAYIRSHTHTHTQSLAGIIVNSTLVCGGCNTKHASTHMLDARCLDDAEWHVDEN